MQRIVFPNYFFIKLLMSQQEGNADVIAPQKPKEMMSRCLPSALLPAWAWRVLPHGPHLQAALALVRFGQRAGEPQLELTRVPSPSGGGFTVVFCVPQRSHSSCPVALPKQLSLQFP